MRSTLTALTVTGLLALTACSSADGAKGSEREISLPAETSMGAIDLVVRERDDVLPFYETALGLSVLDSDKEQTTLGQGELPVVRLIEDDDAPMRAQQDAGLFHLALLYPDSEALANTLVQVAQHAPETFQGGSDHAVSIAFYFADPEGNGIELYVDTPKDQWQWNDGEVTMGSAAVDINAFMGEHATAEPVDEVTMGHIHLSVGDLEAAEEFYVDTLGFDVTSRSEGALFMSAGGYHHHLAANTWNSTGARPRPAVQTGMGSFRVQVPDAATVEAISERLTAADHDAELSEGVLTTRDPWNNVVEISTP